MKKLFFILYYFLIPSLLNAEETLKFYIIKALENNLQLNAERKKLESAKEDKNISRSEFLPSITISGDQTSTTSTNQTNQNGSVLNDSNIESYVLKDTILEHIINNKGKLKLSEIKRPIIISQEYTKIPELFDELLKKREHISLVVDQYNTTLGIVTLEDIIETILGYEIVDETDMVDDMQVLAKKIKPKLNKT